jgi:hypothetical protein
LLRCDTVSYIHRSGIEILKKGIPEWISYYEERNIDLVGIFEDVVAGRLDHFTVCYDNFTAIESLLLP